MNDLEIQVTGGFFLAAAAMLWVGWTLLPAKIGAFFVPPDFAAVGRRDGCGSDCIVSICSAMSLL